MTREGVTGHSDSARGHAIGTSWRIEPGYVDARGQPAQISPAVMAELQRALGLGDHGRGMSARRVITLANSQHHFVDLPAPPHPSSWRLLQGHQVIASGDSSTSVPLPSPLATGSYQLAIEGPEPAEALVLAAPREAYQPPFFRDGGRGWLLAVQLYSVRSNRNWGHGDFTDLAALLQIAAQIGAVGVGVNPLHALGPGQASPYSPSSRAFLNPLYIDIEAVPELGDTSANRFTPELSNLRSAELVDYISVHNVKYNALRTAYGAFGTATSTERRAAFDAFCIHGGKPLQLYCAFEHLRGRFGGGWQSWPAEWRDPEAALEKLDPAEIEFHAFVQWIAHEQLTACRELARNLGLPVGLYLDIAVGVDAGGADVWAAQDTFPAGLSIGAPPDVYNPAGQNWGLAAPHPQALIDSDFAMYRQALRSAMQYAGAVRIDHALGLNRLFLLAADVGGGYVSLPFEAMLAVTAQESVAHRCLVIGEDLGTIPDGICETLNRWGVWSYKVALFERATKEQFIAPDRYPERAIVTFNTHDLPSFSGWVEGHDLQSKAALGLDPGETQQERADTLRAMRNTLVHQGLSPDLTLDSVVRYLARARSQLLSVGVEDVLALKDQPNIPGTIDEHPNWRRKLPVDLEELARSTQLHRIATVLAEEGRGFARSA
jgi:4-alpha-glucanotransferase